MSKTTQKKSALGFLTFLYSSIYLVCFVSWVFFRDYYQRKFHYSTVDIIYLFLMSLPLLLPVSVWWARKHVQYLRTKSAAFVTLSLVAPWYLIFSFFYYNTQEHLFDPFVQMSPPLLDKNSIEKSGKAWRILTLGGSTTRGVNLPKEESYPSVLQAILRDVFPSRAIEVFNGGVEWYTTKHSLINYATHYQDWKPAAVIVMHGVNDLFRSCVPSEFAVGPYQDEWTHFYGPAARGSRPLTFERFVVKPILRPWISRFTSGTMDYPPEFYVSRNAFEANLRKLVRMIKDHGSFPVLVTEPSLYKEQMPAEEIQKLWMGRVLCNTVSYLIFEEYPSYVSLYRGMKLFSQTVKKVAASEGAYLVDAETLIDKDLKTFSDDVHYTKAGANALAKIVAAETTRSGIIK